MKNEKQEILDEIQRRINEYEDLIEQRGHRVIGAYTNDRPFVEYCDKQCVLKSLKEYIVTYI